MKEGRIPKVLKLIRRDGVHVLDVEAGMVLLGAPATTEAESPESAPRPSEPPPTRRGGSRTGLS